MLLRINDTLKKTLPLMRTPFTGQPSEGGIFMKYSYEYKRQCVTLYRQGSWPLTPKGVQPQHFRDIALTKDTLVP